MIPVADRIVWITGHPLFRVWGHLKVVSGYIHESRHFHWHDISVDRFDFYLCGNDLKFIKFYIAVRLCTSAWPSAQSGPFQEVFRINAKATFFLNRSTDEVARNGRFEDAHILTASIHASLALFTPTSPSCESFSLHW